MKSPTVRLLCVLAMVLLSESSLSAQTRIFGSRNRNRNRNSVPQPKRLNAAHEKAKTEADQAYQKGNYQRTIDLTNSVISQNRLDHVAYYLRGSARVELGIQKRDLRSIRSGIADAREAIRIEGTKSPMYYLPYLYGMTNLSMIEGRKEHAEVAVTVATHAIGIRTLKPDDKANLYYQRATSSTYLQKYDKAAADFTEAIRLSPAHLGAYVGAADAYANAGKTAQATVAHTKAVDSFPNNPLVYNNRGMFLQQQNKPIDAIVDFTRAIELDSKYHYAFTNRGYCLLQTGDATAAEADYTASLKIDPSQPSVYGLRASARLVGGDVKGAVADNRQVIRLTPRNPNSHGDLGFALFFAADYIAAERSFAQALALNVNQRHLDPWRYLSLERSGQKTAATTRFAAVLKKDRALRSWVDSLIVYLAGQQTGDELLKSIDSKDAAIKSAQLCEAHFFIGLRDSETGNTKSAQQNFQKSVATKQSHLSAFQGANLALKRVATTDSGTQNR